MPICNLTIQLVAANLYTKFEVSILNSCGDIFDEKSGERNQNKYREEQNRRMPICNLTIHLVVANLYTKFEVSILNSFGDIFDEKSGERKQNKYREELIGEGPFSIPQYN